MPQSLSHLLVHIVFSTKDRRPLLNSEWIGSMHAYLAGAVRGAGCDCHRVGGVADHVHIAVGLSRTVSVANLVEAIKTSSSKWAKANCPDFAWQRGYGAFSMTAACLPQLLAYIDNQAEHHEMRTFADEYRDLLKEHNVVCDERYMWD